jgi:hypothetical protein
MNPVLAQLASSPVVSATGPTNRAAIQQGGLPSQRPSRAGVAGRVSLQRDPAERNGQMLPIAAILPDVLRRYDLS